MITSSKPKQFKPTIAMQRNANMALRCKDHGSKAGTRVGWYRATQLSQRKPLSLDVVKRIRSFERHRKNAEYTGNPCKDKGYVMWKAWGGDEGVRWAKNIIKKHGGKRK